MPILVGGCLWLSIAYYISLFVRVANNLTLLYITLLLLRLIDERANGAAQDSISYVSAGYAPLLVRLVQLLGHNGVSWDCVAEALKQLPGPVLEFTQQAACPEDLSEALERWVFCSVMSCRSCRDPVPIILCGAW